VFLGFGNSVDVVSNRACLEFNPEGVPITKHVKINTIFTFDLSRNFYVSAEYFVF